MFQGFALRHIPALIVASTMTFGGIWPMFKPRDAMLEFGFQPHVAGSPAAAPVMVAGQARGTIIGALVFVFYSRGRMDVVDTIMAVTGAYAGLVDSCVVWRQGGRRGMAVFRGVCSGLLAAWGLAGWTAGGQ